MKKIITISLSIAMVLAFVACESSKAKVESTEIPNPVVLYNTIKEAQAAVTFSSKVISDIHIPEGYEFKNTSVIDEYLLEVNYANDNINICYRTADAKYPIHGVYEKYPDKKERIIKDTEVIINFTGDQVNLVTWRDADDFAYSLFFTYAEGATLDMVAIESMISSVL